MGLDVVQRRVRAQVMSMVTAAYPRTPAVVPVCTCSHCDDDHHGARGELECSVCGCGGFVLAGFAETT